MSALKPSKMLNMHLDKISYGLSQINPAITGENNMAYPAEKEQSHRNPELVSKARREFFRDLERPRHSFQVDSENFGSVVDVADINPQSSPLVYCDALISNKPEVMLQTLFADCCPILLVDPIAPVVGIIHASWSATVHNVVGNTILKMVRSYNSDPSDIIAYMGPTICIEHYQRPDSMGELSLMLNLSLKAGVEAVYKRKSADSLHLDIKATNRRVLNRYNVTNIEESQICTFEDPFQPSARRDDRRLGGPYRSNAMAAIMLRP